jgi:hypothetical protein
MEALGFALIVIDFALVCGALIILLAMGSKREEQGSARQTNVRPRLDEIAVDQNAPSDAG